MKNRVRCLETRTKARTASLYPTPSFQAQHDSSAPNSALSSRERGMGRVQSAHSDFSLMLLLSRGFTLHWRGLSTAHRESLLGHHGAFPSSVTLVFVASPVSHVSPHLWAVFCPSLHRLFPEASPRCLRGSAVPCGGLEPLEPAVSSTRSLFSQRCLPPLRAPGHLCPVHAVK